MKLKNLILFTSSLFLPILAVAQEPSSADQSESLAALCEKQLCRATNFQLEQDNGEIVTFEREMPVPIVFEEWVTVVPGDVIHIVGEVLDDKLVNLKAVAEPKEGESTITIKLSQHLDGENRMMILMIQNPFDQPLKYHAGMQVLDKDDLLKTTTCAVMPGLTTAESWPHPIIEMQLFEFRLLEQGLEQRVCEF
jgi:hypothetical protein